MNFHYSLILMYRGGNSHMTKTILTKIEEMITPILIERDVTLEDIQYVREGNNNYLRLFIDKTGGIDLDECSIVSELVSEKLDEEDPINGAYFLEISSPGAEKPLKTKEDFANNVGKNVYVTLYVHIDGEKEYEGTLQQFEQDTLTIEYKYKHTKKTVDIPYDKVAKARLSVML